MTTSRREYILQNIKTALEAITVAHGYNNTVASVQRWAQKGNILQSVPAIIINSGQEEKRQEPNPQVTCKFTVYLDVWTRQDDTDTTPSDQVVSGLLLDVEKALMADYTRGGYAGDTRVMNNVPFETVDGMPSFGVQIEVEIIYKHLLTDPAAYV
jgi:hypothetical protein